MDFKKIFQGIGKFFLGGSNFGSTVWSWAFPGGWSKNDLVLQYRRYVYSVVSTIAENAARVDFEIKKKNLKNEFITVDSHPFLDLIRKPNPMQSQFQFMELHFTFLKLTGESFWYIAKGETSLKPKELYILRPDLMEVAIDKTDPRGLVSGYVLNKPTGERITLEPDEVVHFKLPNPFNAYRGYGPIQAGQVYIETEQFTSLWSRNSIYNSGRPSGVLNIKGTIDNDAFKQLKREFKQEYTGTSNAGKTLLLKGQDGLDFVKLGMELDGVALKELKDLSRDDIMLMFRASKTILGITDDVNRANAQEQRAVFTENLIKPELDRLVDHLNAFVIPLWGEGYKITYEDPTMETDEQRLAMYREGWNKWLTINDIRTELDLPLLPGGDVIREPIQNTPTAGPAPKQGKNYTPLDIDLLKKKDYREQKVALFIKLFFENQTLWEHKYQEVMKDEFETQLIEILKRNKDIFPSWLFNVDASKQRIIGTLVPLGFQLMKEAASLAFDLADDNLTNFVISEKIKEYITDRVDRMITDTNQLTKDKIEEAILLGTQSGESVSDLANRIRDVYENADEVRAELIARTETLAVSNEAALEAYRQSPLVESKEWSAESDACEYCAALDGKIVGLEEDFAATGTNLEGDEGGERIVSYEDIEHPPAHPNCRCALLPVARE